MALDFFPLYHTLIGHWLPSLNHCLYVMQIIFYPWLINSTYIFEEFSVEQFNTSVRVACRHGKTFKWTMSRIDLRMIEFLEVPCHLWGCASHQIPLSSFKMLSILHNHPWLLQQFRMWCWTLKVYCMAVVCNCWVTTWKKGEQQGEKTAECQRFSGMFSYSNPWEKNYKIIYKIVSFLSQHMSL